MVTKRSHILKQTCSWNFLLPPEIKGLRFHVSVYQAIRQEKVYTNDTGTVKIDPHKLATNFAILNGYVKVINLRFVKKTFLSG